MEIYNEQGVIMKSNKKLALLVSLCFVLLSATLANESAATPPGMRMKAWNHHQQLKRESLFKDLKWRAVGPEFQGRRKRGA